MVYFAFGVSKYEGNNSNLRCCDWGEALAVCMNTFQSDVAMYNSLSFKVVKVLSLLWRYSRSKSYLYWWRVFASFYPLCYKYKQFVDSMQCCNMLLMQRLMVNLTVGWC